MTPQGILNSILGFILVALVAMGVTGVLSYKRMAGQLATAKADIHQARADATAAKLETQKLSKLTIERDHEVANIRDRVSSLQPNIEKAKHEDPATADLLRARLPGGLRRAYNQDAHIRP